MAALFGTYNRRVHVAREVAREGLRDTLFRVMILGTDADTKARLPTACTDMYYVTLEHGRAGSNAFLPGVCTDADRRLREVLGRRRTRGSIGALASTVEDIRDDVVASAALSDKLSAALKAVLFAQLLALEHSYRRFDEAEYRRSGGGDWAASPRFDLFTMDGQTTSTVRKAAYIDLDSRMQAFADAADGKYAEAVQLSESEVQLLTELREAPGHGLGRLAARRENAPAVLGIGAKMFGTLGRASWQEARDKRMVLQGCPLGAELDRDAHEAVQTARRLISLKTLTGPAGVDPRIDVESCRALLVWGVEAGVEEAGEVLAQLDGFMVTRRAKFKEGLYTVYEGRLPKPEELSEAQLQRLSDVLEQPYAEFWADAMAEDGSGADQAGPVAGADPAAAGEPGLEAALSGLTLQEQAQP